MGRCIELSDVAWKKVLDFFRNKLSYLIEDDGSFVLYGESVRDWDDHKNMVRRNLYNTPEHYSRVLEISKRGKVTQLSHKQIKDYEPLTDSYIVVIEEIEGTDYQEIKVYQKQPVSPGGLRYDQEFKGLALYSNQLSSKLVDFFEVNAMAKSDKTMQHMMPLEGVMFIFVDIGKLWMKIEDEDIQVPEDIQEELRHIGKMMFKEKQDYLLIMKIEKAE